LTPRAGQEDAEGQGLGSSPPYGRAGSRPPLPSRAGHLKKEIMMSKPPTIRFWRGQLPHWEVMDADYFITMRLAGTLPHFLKDELKQIIKDANGRGYWNTSRKYFVKMEAWLDNDYTNMILIQDQIANIITSTFEIYESKGICKFYSYVIMPNHIHWFFRPLNQSMSEIIQNIKRITARMANQSLGRTGRRFWQKEWFDHWSRTPEESEKIIQYIRNNPVKAGLVAKPEEWPYLK
jgi:REP element-mobilizing transposase RayT